MFLKMICIYLIYAKNNRRNVSTDVCNHRIYAYACSRTKWLIILHKQIVEYLSTKFNT